MKILSIDDDLTNSDWLKMARLDIPEIKYFAQLVKYVGIDPVSDYEELVEFHSGHPWLSNVFPETEAFMKMYEEKSKKNKEKK